MSKRLVTASALALVLGSHGLMSRAAADEMIRTTEKTTTYDGVVSQVNPSSSTIILQSQGPNAPAYMFSKETIFVDPEGRVVASETIKDAPVTLTYHQEGDRMIVTKVEVKRPVVRKETTTTTTTEE